MNELQPPDTQILTRRDGATIAYRHLEGDNPGIVFLHGLNSDKDGTKAVALLDLCRREGRGFLAMDMFGHGESSGDFMDGTISRWVDDVYDVMLQVCSGPQVVVGSSMGGWIMLRVALEQPSLVSGLIGIAAAPDFTEDLMWAAMSAADREHLQSHGFIEQPSEYSDDPYIISLKLIEDGRENLVLRAPIPITKPVHLLHGQQDDDVPWRVSLDVQDKVEGEDVTVTLVKDGDHRLSREQDLDLLRLVAIRMMKESSSMAAVERA